MAPSRRLGQRKPTSSMPVSRIPSPPLSLHHQSSQPDPHVAFANYHQHPPSVSVLAASRSFHPTGTSGLDNAYPAGPSFSSPPPPYKSLHNKAIPNRDHLRYSLTVHQQPHRARMVGNGAKADRRPIDPAPVLRLEAFDSLRPKQSSVDLTLLRSPYFICYCTLCETNDPDNELFMIPHSGKPYMTGSIVSSTYHIRDVNLAVPPGHYFLFSDLGVRVEGLYRLKFSVFEIVNERVFFCASVISDEFEVFTAKRFPGMEQTTAITETLALQGLRLRARNKTAPEFPPAGRQVCAEPESKKPPKRKECPPDAKPAQPTHKPKLAPPRKLELLPPRFPLPGLSMDQVTTLPSIRTDAKAKKRPQPAVLRRPVRFAPQGTSSTSPGPMTEPAGKSG